MKLGMNRAMLLLAMSALVGALALMSAASWSSAVQAQTVSDKVQAPAQAQGMPRLWRAISPGSQPDLSEIKQIRVLTTGDYPPFNYVNRNGWLSGLNIDLLRALCSELKLKCEIKAAPWDKLVDELKAGNAEAVMAGMSITSANLRRVSLSQPYLRLPARFVVLKSSKLNKFTPAGLINKRIGVVNNSAHEAYLKSMFPRSEFVPYPGDAAAREAVQKGKVAALFGDGVKLSLWVRGSRSQKCCELRGGPYTESLFFGDGMAVAVKRGNTDLARVFDYGFARLYDNGKYAELVRKHLPGAFIGSGR